MNAQAVGYCAYPLVLCSFAAHAPEIVTVISGLFAIAWYGLQLYTAFKAKGKDDETPSS